ncbi:MAG TPA: SDR family NAD(P)-dependent oxidoreductase, partial [Longimicrobiaceae bacterium]|nr:SDR family NAD(P)-dependent oxidoreductase [Longimicrobiaceae bacterium]
MDLGVRDRVALVVGGSSGLGRAVARELLREKAKVVIAARHEGRLRDAAEALRRETGGQIATISADVTRPADIDRLVEQTVERWGRLDIVVANAGGPRGGTFESATPEQFEH